MPLNLELDTIRRGRPTKGSVYLYGSLPAITGHIELSERGNPLSIEADLPAITGSIGLYTGANPLSINADLPAITGDTTLTHTDTANLSGDLPAVTGSVGLSVPTSTISLSSNLPVITGSQTLTYIKVTSLSSNLPAIDGSATIAKTDTADLSSTLPEVTGTAGLSTGVSYLVQDTFTASPTTGTRTLGGGVTVANGRAALPANTSWKGVTYQGVTRANGVAMLARLIYGDIQAGAGLSGGVATPTSAAGFFDAVTPTDPGLTSAGNALATFNAGAQSGGFSSGGAIVVASAKQIGFDHITMLRDRGSIHFVAANPTARSIGSRPVMRPVFIEQARATPTVYPAVHIRDAGASVDELAVRTLEEYPNWYGPATAADALSTASGTAPLSTAQVGGSWSAAGYTKTTTGAQRSGSGVATLAANTNAYGILAIEFTVGTVYGHEFEFYFTNLSNYVNLTIQSATTVALYNVTNGGQSVIASWPVASMANSTQRFVLVFQGRTVRVFKNGADITTSTPATIPATNTGTGVGFYLPNSLTRASRFEFQPVSVPIPTSLRLKTPWAPLTTTSTPVTEDFAGTGTMEGKTSTTGGLVWTRTTGNATLTRNGAGAALPSNTGGFDTYYSAPYSAAYVDLLLNFTASGTSMSDVASFATSMVTDGTRILSCRSFAHTSQPGTTEFEILSDESGTMTIVLRVAMALEIVPGATQSFRFVVDTVTGICGIWFGNEPVGEYRHTLGTITRVGYGVGANDSGTALLDYSVSIP